MVSVWLSLYCTMSERSPDVLIEAVVWFSFDLLQFLPLTGNKYHKGNGHGCQSLLRMFAFKLLEKDSLP